MKTKLNPRTNPGMALLVSLFLVTILAVSIGGYLTYVQQQSLLSVRSQTWNVALSISEAGIEEGLQQLHNNTSDLSADGWSQSGNVYSITRNLPGGNSYTVYLSNAIPNSPIIVSRAYVNPSVLTMNTAPLFFASAGVEKSPDQVTRAIRVTTTRGSLFLAALVARHKIDMNGQNILTDSYDSGDPNKSTNGQYDPAKAGDAGDVASNSGVVNAVHTGNANIYGKVHVGPGGTAGIGSQGKIGSHDWQAGNTGIQPGWVYNNANFTFPDTTLPYTSGLPPTGGYVTNISGTNIIIADVKESPTLPGALEPNQFVGPITTNTRPATSSGHPGNVPGLSTNAPVWVTSSSYPGNIPGLITNCIGFTTVISYPGSRMCMTTNCGSTLVKDKDFPTAYCGTPTQTGQGNNNNSDWSYYPVIGYTYANQFSYTYPTYTYSYVVYTYNYIIYEGQLTYEVNYYDNILYTGDYSASELNGKTLVVGNARLVMADGLSMSGNDQIIINNGGSLKLYSGGDVKIGGNGTVNKTGFAGNLILYCTDNVKKFELDGNGTFCGIVVAPGANVKLNGGGNSYEDFMGSLMANTITMNGHFKFHYDEALSRYGGTGRFLITSWDEIP